MSLPQDQAFVTLAGCVRKQAGDRNSTRFSGLQCRTAIPIPPIIKRRKRDSNPQKGFCPIYSFPASAFDQLSHLSTLFRLISGISIIHCLPAKFKAAHFNLSGQPA